MVIGKQVSNQKYMAIIGAIMGWFAVITQYYLMVNNTTMELSITEITIRFFSFFTILTNSLVSIYCTAYVIKNKNSERTFFERPGIMTAIAVYITVVGLVYQIVLRPLWNPQGLQMVVDELLHSVMPLYFVLYWYLYENKARLQWNQVIGWLVYPLAYLVFILIRGSLSNFYPYPFVDVHGLGLWTVFINSTILLLFFVILSLFFIKAGKKLGSINK